MVKKNNHRLRHSQRPPKKIQLRRYNTRMKHNCSKQAMVYSVSNQKNRDRATLRSYQEGATPSYEATQHKNGRSNSSNLHLMCTLWLLNRATRAICGRTDKYAITSWLFIHWQVQVMISFRHRRGRPKRGIFCWTYFGCDESKFQTWYFEWWLLLNIPNHLYVLYPNHLHYTCFLIFGRSKNLDDNTIHACGKDLFFIRQSRKNTHFYPKIKRKCSACGKDLCFIRQSRQNTHMLSENQGKSWVKV